MGTMGHDMDIPPTQHVNSMPIDYDDDDDWVSSEPGIEAGEDDIHNIKCVK